YLRPLHDALHDMLPAEEVQKHTERGVIEIAPLAYMRGRTLNHAFIILDEAQNSTAEQMFMFLTRLGINSKAVITGDETQIDLPPHKQSGLLEAHRALRHIEGIAIVEFTKRDVVRHPLVQRIIAAYEEHRGRARYRGPTDVITFDYREESVKALPCPALHGEIFICVEKAIRQAREFRVSWPGELTRYLVHGVLHLLGFKDLRAADRQRMKREEDR